VSALAPLGPGERGRVRLRQPWVWRLQQTLGNYLPLALMALLAAYTTWLVRQTPSAEGPVAQRAVRSTPDYEMRGFELQRFAAGGESQAWLRGAALRHYPDDDRIEVDGVELRLQDPQRGWLLAQAQRALGPESGEWLRLSGEVRVRRYAAGADPARGDAPLMELRTRELLAERDAQRLSATTPTEVSTPRLRARVAGFRYAHGKDRLDFDGPSRFEIPPRRP
jgi:lipopolysaccharide export system protein LptC